VLLALLALYFYSAAISSATATAGTAASLLMRVSANKAAALPCCSRSAALLGRTGRLVAPRLLPAGILLAHFCSSKG